MLLTGAREQAANVSDRLGCRPDPRRRAARPGRAAADFQASLRGPCRATLASGAPRPRAPGSGTMMDSLMRQLGFLADAVAEPAAAPGGHLAYLSPLPLLGGRAADARLEGIPPPCVSPQHIPWSRGDPNGSKDAGIDARR